MLKVVPFLEVISGVVVHKIRNWWRWANLSSESPTIQSHWPFQVWTISQGWLGQGPISIYCKQEYPCCIGIHCSKTATVLLLAFIFIEHTIMTKNAKDRQCAKFAIVLLKLQHDKQNMWPRAISVTCGHCTWSLHVQWPHLAKPS